MSKPELDYAKDVKWMMENVSDAMKDFFIDEMKNTEFEITADDDAPNDVETITGDQLYTTDSAAILLDALSYLTEELGDKNVAWSIKTTEKIIVVTILLRRQLIYQKSIEEEEIKKQSTQKAADNDEPSFTDLLQCQIDSLQQQLNEYRDKEEVRTKEKVRIVECRDCSTRVRLTERDYPFCVCGKKCWKILHISMTQAEVDEYNK